MASEPHQLAQRKPSKVRSIVREANAKLLPADFDIDIDIHFNPP
ncbi:hypothetical protein GCM10027068_39840 [Prescottella soli]